MRHPEFPVASFLSLPLLLCSLPSHIRSGSVCIIALIAWLAVMSVIRGINALVWADNILVRLEVWCDITTKLTIGFTYAIPASALCVLRHLESVASARKAHATKADKRHRQIFEAIMCFGVPMIFMALHYIVQGHRFDLIENFGCYPTQYFSVAALVILWVPPLVMSLASFVYAGLALRHFLRHRISFATHLRNSQSSISAGRYFRLMALAIFEMAWDTGINTYILWFNITSGFQPWISWENVHSNFSRVATFPEWIFPPIFINQLIWQWWIIPISCLFFFVFFAFGEEALADYRMLIIWFRQSILRQNDYKQTFHNFAVLFPAHQSSSPGMGITFPPKAGIQPERRGWDEMSSMNDSSMHWRGFDNDCESQVWPCPDKHSKGTWDTAPLPPGFSQRPACSSFPGCSTAAQDLSIPVSAMSYSQNHVPCNLGSIAPTALSSVTLSPIPSPNVCHVTSSAVFRPTTLRLSTSGDTNIVVSPPCLPDMETSSHNHEKNLSAQPTPLVAPHCGGVLMTVETSTV